MKRKILFFSILIVVVISLGVILSQMYLQETKVELVQTANIPTMPILSEISPGDYRGKAIAIDGEIMQGTNAADQRYAGWKRMDAEPYETMGAQALFFRNGGAGLFSVKKRILFFFSAHPFDEKSRQQQLTEWT